MLRREKEKGIECNPAVKDIRSPFLFGAGLLSVCAALTAIPGVLLLFDTALTEKLFALMSIDYIDASAQMSWMFVRALINVLGLLVPILIAVGVWLMLAAAYQKQARSMPLWGVNYFMRGASITKVIVLVISAILAVLFVVRVVRYIILYGLQTGGILFVFAMLLPECVFAAVAAIILFLTFRGIKCVIYTLDTIQLNFLTGRNESYGLNFGAVVMVFMIGVAAIVLCVINRDSLWALLSFGMAAAADIMLAIWLQIYRKKVGRRALEEFRIEKNT